jgi:hypothetical protein
VSRACRGACPSLTERLRSFSYRRQRLGRSHASPLQALRDVIGVYSTHPTAPLALLARCVSLTPAAFNEMERTGAAVRVSAMRGSIFLVPTDSLANILAATRVPLEKYAPTLRYASLTIQDFQKLAQGVLESCQQPATPADLRSVGPADKDTYMVARVLARQGRILRVGGSLRTDQLKYVATESWLGKPIEEADQRQAQKWLAAEYLRAFGPARAADFGWWAGLTRRSAEATLSELDTIDCDGLLVLREDFDAFETVEPLGPDAVDVLPKWDSYTMGYAPDGRQRLVDDRFLNRAYTSVAGSPGATAGDGLPLVLRSGGAVASWSHRFDGNRLMVTVTPFEGEQLADSAFAAVGELLSASSIVVTTQDQAQA